MMGGNWGLLNFLLLGGKTQKPVLCCPSETPRDIRPNCRSNTAGFMRLLHPVYFPSSHSSSPDDHLLKKIVRASSNLSAPKAEAGRLL